MAAPRVAASRAVARKAVPTAVNWEEVGRLVGAETLVVTVMPPTQASVAEAAVAGIHVSRERRRTRRGRRLRHSSN